MREYVKLYRQMREDYYQKWGEYFHPQSWQDFEMSNQEIFEKHLEKYHDSSDKVLKIKLYIDLVLNNIQYFGYYFAFCEGSFERLNNALLQTGRTCLLRGGITHSGTAYTGNIIKGIFTCFACNDFEVSESFVPNNLPLLRGTFYTENVVNLFHSIYYKDDERLEEALSKAESFLTKKKLTGIAEYYVRFFCFLAKKDAEGITQCLQKLCEAHQRQGYPIQKIDKCFLKDFEEWQIKNNFPKGEQFYKYPEKLHEGNLILQSPLPVIHLDDIDGKLSIDVERFATELSNSAK